ncbi:MAG: energy-coupling factor transporter ATPase [Oscillospiraceae bacterium]|nr:energy-coupling factor transporter ATPase [Oscillospiraceae bacterium]
MPLMELRGLTHIYSQGTPFEKAAVDHIDLTICQGQTVGLLGHTGSGKSTLIQHMNALLKPTEGAVLLDGQDIYASKEAMRAARFRVGLVFQYPEYQLFEENVFDDIAFGPKNQKLPPEEIDRRVREAAAFVGLGEDTFSQSPLEISGGQKRRAAIAGVLAMEPELLVLDEPTAGLDPAGRADLLERLLAWKKARNATILLVTHDMDIAAGCCERLLVMDGGRIVMDGGPAEIFSQGDRLQAMGLDLPGAARIAMLLRRKGAALPEDIYTTDRLREAILTLRGKEGRPC